MCLVVGCCLSLDGVLAAGRDKWAGVFLTCFSAVFGKLAGSFTRTSLSVMKASSRTVGAGRLGPVVRRPMGKRCCYEDSFLSESVVLRLCLQRQRPGFLAGQVIIAQRLMMERRWRRADLAAHSGLKRGQISKVLNVQSFPDTVFWLKVARAFDLEIDAFDRLVLAWEQAEIPRS